MADDTTLHHYHFRDAQQTSLSLSGVKYANKAEVDEVIDVLRDNPVIRSLDLDRVNMSSQWLETVLEAAATCPNLQQLTLSGNPLQGGAVDALLNGIAHWPRLDCLMVNDCHLQPGDAKRLCNQLQQHSNLSAFGMHTNDIGAEGVEAAANLIAHSPAMRSVILSQTGINDHLLPEIGNAIAQHDRITNCELFYNPLSEEAATALAQQLSEAPCRNFIYTPFPNPALDDFCSRNKQATKRLITELKGVDEDKPNLTHLPGHILTAMDARQPALQALVHPKSLATAVHQHIESLPDFESNATSAQALFQRDGRGYTPLDNPQCWQNIGSIARQMSVNGAPLTLDMLVQPSRSGEPFLRAGLAGRPETVIPALNAADIRLPASLFLSADHSPTGMLQSLIDDGSAALLFTEESLQGQSPQDVKRLYQALPDEQQRQVGNYHALLASLKHEQSLGGVGR